ncbi:hypothetical protein ACTXGQ_07960 [Marinobacter sp. 1Y8]
MFQFNKTLTYPLAFAAAIAFAPAAMAQDAAGMGQKMGKMSGAMAGVAKVCGDASDQELAESKKKQKAMLAKNGLDMSAFEEAYVEGESEATQKFAALSSAKRTEACEQIKQQMGAAAQQPGN